MSERLPALQLALRAGVAAALAVMLARALALPFPLYAVIAAVLVMDLSPARTRKSAVPRLAGTLLGASLGAIIGPFAGGQPWAVALGIAIAMFACEALEMKDAAKLAGYVCGIVLLEHARDAPTYALYRLAETLLGVVAAVAVSMVPRLIEPAAKAGDGS